MAKGDELVVVNDLCAHRQKASDSQVVNGPTCTHHRRDIALVVQNVEDHQEDIVVRRADLGCRGVHWRGVSGPDERRILLLVEDLL